MFPNNGGMTVLRVTAESWPIRGRFSIARGSKTAADVILCEIESQGHIGRGESVPYKRYGETVPDVLLALSQNQDRIVSHLSHGDIANLPIPMSARNCLDCALWDLEAKQASRPVWQLANLPEPQPALTAYTISLAEPNQMAESAARAAHLPLLKIKLGGTQDRASMAAIRKSAPNARLIVDANEGWTASNIAQHFSACHDCGVELIEQPLPDGEDEILKDIARPVPVCADESAHGAASFAGLTEKYDAINVKLDKTGGLTPAIAAVREAQRLNLKIMTGCMVATSLSMAPALLLSSLADYIDLDGPLLLENDRPNGLNILNGIIAPASPDLWG